MGVEGYQGMLEIIFPTIEWLGEDDGDYQGNWICVGRDRVTGQFYYKTGYYGSCSGCDEYEAVGPNDPGLIADMSRITPIPIDVLQYVKNEAQLVLPDDYDPVIQPLLKQLIDRYGTEMLIDNRLVAGIPVPAIPHDSAVDQYEQSDHIKIWDSRTVPLEIRRYIATLDDADWVAVVPPRYEDCYIPFLSNDSFGCCNIIRCVMGRCIIYVGYHG